MGKKSKKRSPGPAIRHVKKFNPAVVAQMDLFFDDHHAKQRKNGLAGYKEDKIYETTDYSLFHKIKSNRELSESHINKLVMSYKKGDHGSVIMVNKDGGVLSGQQRFAALQKLGMPIKFMVRKNLAMENVVSMETTVKAWNMNDFLHHHLQREEEKYSYNSRVYSTKPYHLLKEVIDQFAGTYTFSVSLILTILDPQLVQDTRSQMPEGREHKSKNQQFKEGDFKFSIEEKNNLIKNVKKLLQVRTRLPEGCQSLTLAFVKAYMFFLHMPNFSHNEFFKRITPGVKGGHPLENRHNVEDYKAHFLHLYNKSKVKKNRLKLT